MRKFSLAALTSAFALAAGMAAAEEIKVGVSPGEHGEIMEEVAKVAKDKGLTIDIVEFTDYVVPNQALADGDLQANSFQHQPYLDNQIKDRGFALVSIAKTITTPMGVYSQKLKSLDELPEGAKVAIPNDPTNGGRALLLLQDKGIVTLAEDTGLTPSPLDVTGNPKSLKFLELDAAQLPRALADTDIAVINTNYALDAGLNPNEDAIAMEKPDSPYANIIVVRQGDEDAPWARQLVEAYHDPAVKQFIEEKYQGAVIPAW
ncbi:MetQ/NlpA family ABC transporter substrate-binding protein [Paracoccus sp. P2]|uniref:MetQ/NlpA family ABC transporter substrate-binding protein n=1 Tax=Paracoccus pantotrophus TaxID=82367 RepID=A0A7H9BTD2_PARPN|nr:MetQ/NlpA family ABC transporter substrate-binding protein [Paracoccus pantotrophus]MDF3852922.1 MetQ/NlpA family ABC transporter substrate-binding protein [Paracoccus pantotrophus]QLH13988.1 MetQ/NlpA family ABC transporter substrate-binding protein [Paracoccus pantotrophus]RNI17395.1 MetQ/NlpA family ABC transporter substrate-binding protein [Paracoccus pantotrophus]SFN87298.1 D-methionine transport system substrate-binding protein [Paracoccus pantotrophus]